MAIYYTGPVTIADDETVSGNGLGRVLYDAIASVQQAYKALPSLTPPDDWPQTPAAWVAQAAPIRLSIMRAWAREANAHAQAASTRNFHTLTTTGYVVQPDDDVLVVPGAVLAGNAVIQLPACSASAGRKIVVKTLTMGGFNVTPQVTGFDTIDGTSPTGPTLAGDFKSRTYLCDGVISWYSVGEGAF